MNPLRVKVSKRGGAKGKPLPKPPNKRAEHSEHPVWVSIEELRPHPRNVNIHNRKNIGVIKHSLQTFGQIPPVIANREGYVLKGNGTLEAAKELGFEKLYCMFVDMDENSEEAFAIIDNRSSDLSQLDKTALLDTLERLEHMENLSPEDFGFSGAEVQKLFNAGADSGPKPRPETFSLEFPSDTEDLFIEAKELYNDHNASIQDVIISIVEGWIRRKNK